MREITRHVSQEEGEGYPYTTVRMDRHDRPLRVRANTDGRRLVIQMGTDPDDDFRNRVDLAQDDAVAWLLEALKVALDLNNEEGENR